MLVYLPFTHYLAGSIVVLALYYITIWLLYFKKKLAAGTSIHQQINLFAGPGMKNNVDISANTDLSPDVHDFLDELNALLLQSAAESMLKETLSTCVNKLLQKYESIKSSAFQPAITNLIAVEAENKCNIHFDAEELAALWNPPS